NAHKLREALHFKGLYHLQPAAVVSYDRQAFSGTADSEKDLRVTFDYNIMCRSDNLGLENGPKGYPIIDYDTVILEVKVSNSVPLWLARSLSEPEVVKE